MVPKTFIVQLVQKTAQLLSTAVSTRAFLFFLPHPHAIISPPSPDTLKLPRFLRHQIREPEKESRVKAKRVEGLKS